MITVAGDETIGQIVPQAVSGQRPVTFYIRVKHPMEKLTLRIGDIFQKKIPYARPGEMIRVRISKKAFGDLAPSITRLKVGCEEHSR